METAFLTQETFIRTLNFRFFKKTNSDQEWSTFCDHFPISGSTNDKKCPLLRKDTTVIDRENHQYASYFVDHYPNNTTTTHHSPITIQHTVSSQSLYTQSFRIL